MKASILNLVPLRQRKDFHSAIYDAIHLAQKVEQWGYERYWIAEHHNTASFASSATSILMDEILAKTKKIKVGSGGIMLPNHTPYIVAEQFGTLETLYPGRVDLGLGRAPGTDMKTALAIRKNNINHDFEEDIKELQGYFEDENAVHAYPAAGLSVPIYILGSSDASAHLAAKLGLPYAFASHFAPGMLIDAVKIYRNEFKPSKYLSKPYVIIGVNTYLADNNKEAKRLMTTQTQAFLGIVTSQGGPLKPALDSDEEVWKNYGKTKIKPHFGPVDFKLEDLVGQEKQIVENMTALSLVGTKKEVKLQVENLHNQVDFDELITTSYIYDEKAQEYSFKLFSEVINEINSEKH